MSDKDKKKDTKKETIEEYVYVPPKKKE